MEPTSYTFTPNQWKILQDLVNETGMDMRNVISRALNEFGTKHSGKNESVESVTTRQDVHPFMPPNEILAIWRGAQDAWKQDSDALLQEIEQERQEWNSRVDSL